MLLMLILSIVFFTVNHFKANIILKLIIIYINLYSAALTAWASRYNPPTLLASLHIRIVSLTRLAVVPNWGQVLSQ